MLFSFRTLRFYRKSQPMEKRQHTLCMPQRTKQIVPPPHDRHQLREENTMQHELVVRAHKRMKEMTRRMIDISAHS